MIVDGRLYQCDFPFVDEGFNQLCQRGLHGSLDGSTWSAYRTGNWICDWSCWNADRTKYLSTPLLLQKYDGWSNVTIRPHKCDLSQITRPLQQGISRLPSPPPVSLYLLPISTSPFHFLTSGSHGIHQRKNNKSHVNRFLPSRFRRRILPYRLGSRYPSLYHPRNSNRQHRPLRISRFRRPHPLRPDPRKNSPQTRYKTIQIHQIHRCTRPSNTRNPQLNARHKILCMGEILSRQGD